MKPTAGSSMFPAILPGSSLETVEKPPQEITVGDIICYPGENKTVIAHRVIDIEQTEGRRTFITRGDAQTTVERIDESAVVAVVVRVVHPLLTYAVHDSVGRRFAKWATDRSIPATITRSAAAMLWTTAVGIKRRLL